MLDEKKLPAYANEAAHARGMRIALLGGAGALLLILLVAGAYVGSRSTRAVANSPPMQSAAPPLIELERMGRLVVARVKISDVLEAKGVKPEIHGLWVVAGDALLVVDMTDIELVTSDDEKKRATLLLPQPEVQSPRVDPTRTKTFDIKSRAWLPWQPDRSGLLARNAMLHAQALVERVAGDESQLDNARRNCELLVHTLYDHVGWQVEVRWRDGSPDPELFTSAARMRHL